MGFIAAWIFVGIIAGVLKLCDNDRPRFRQSYVRNRRGEYFEPYPVRWNLGSIAGSVLVASPVVLWLSYVVRALAQ